MTDSTSPKTIPILDYSLTGVNAALAIEKGLAEADWYQTPLARKTLRGLLTRRDGPAIRDTLLWFGSLGVCAALTVRFWGSWWCVVPYLVFALLYGTASDSRWHEAGHGTAFKTDWMNNALYEIASFMVLREAVVWRWSHTRHHSDTIIVGRDPEIVVPRPPDLRGMALSLLDLPVYATFFRSIGAHAFGRIGADEKTFIPPSEFPKVVLRARVYLGIYVLVGALALTLHSWVPLFLFVLPNLFGSWLMVLYGTTQHAGLAENVLDHRLNCRTVYMNPVSRFLYWNMNYHVEHHMFPLVPYHALPALHEAVKQDCPPPYPSLLSAWREIVPAVWRQTKDPLHHVKRQLPQSPLPARVAPAPAKVDAVSADTAPAAEAGWVPACASHALATADVLRFDHGRKTFIVCRDDAGRAYAADGICTHGNVHLADGLVKGGIIECPKHNGRFHLADGSPARAPVCRPIATYPVREQDGRVWIDLEHAGGAGARTQQAHRFRVVSNRNVATFIKELILEPQDEGKAFSFRPGDYLQVDIPTYGDLPFRDFEIDEPFAAVWRNHHLFDLAAHNRETGKRNNYSIASNAKTDPFLRLNVRIATPPPGQDCTPGVGSSYMFHLKPGDEISAIGPFGDFHIKPTQREMVYIGGGAGMAPLRAHLSHLLETENTARKISFWYGARSMQEVFYAEYFEQLARTHSNFSFHLVLSAPLPEDGWAGLTGFVHEAVEREYLETHERPASTEYYLCGPPMMIKASTRTLAAHNVPLANISYDEF